MPITSLQAFFLPNFTAIWQRFPLPVISAVLFALGGLVEIYEPYYWRTGPGIIWPAQLMFASFLTCFFSLDLALVSESRQWSRRRYLALALPGCAFLAWYGIWCAPYQSFWGFTLLGSALVLGLLVAPYLGKKTNELHFCHYGCSLSTTIFFTILATAILCIGALATLTSIRYLFDVKIENLYEFVFVLSMGLFAPLYALSGIPSRFEEEKSLAEYPKGLRFIVTYLLAPLVLIYCLILYAYFGKMALEQTLPKGNLGIMITLFGSAGLLTVLFATPLAAAGNRLLAKLNRWFFPVLFLPACLLALAVWVRVSAYGLTEQRYVLILFTVWFFLVSLGFSLLRARMQLQYIPMLLAALFLLGSVGPWGAVSLSEKSQVARLATLLEKHHILQEGRIIPTQETVPLADRKAISSIVSYLIQTKKTEQLKQWFELDHAALFKGNNYYTMQQDLVKKMGIQYANRWQKEDEGPREDEGPSFHFQMHQAKKSEAVLMDVRGFDWAIQIFGRYGRKVHTIDGHMSVKIAFNKSVAKVFLNKSDTPILFDLAPVIKDLQKQDIAEGGMLEPYRLEHQTPTLHLRLDLYEIEGHIKDHKPDITTIKGALLLKEVE